MPIKNLLALPFFLFLFLLPLLARAANLFVTNNPNLCNVAQGSSLTYTIGISNQAFDNASDVVLTDLLPGNFGPATATTTQGTCDVNSGGTPNNVVCDLGTMTANALVTVTISTTLVSGGTINADIPNTATATTTSAETDITNNSATAIVTFSKEEKLCFDKQVDNGCSLAAGPARPAAFSWLFLTLPMLGMAFLRKRESRLLMNRANRMKKYIFYFLAGWILSSWSPSSLAASESKPASQPGSSQQATGGISGTLGYPSDAIPPLWVVAFQSNDMKKFQKLETSKNQSTFVISNLAPGEYVVVAYPKSNDPLQGGYSKAVPCGLMATCTDHSLIPVNVEAGKMAKGVKVTDWYAPENAFPPKPATP